MASKLERPHAPERQPLVDWLTSWRLKEALRGVVREYADYLDAEARELEEMGLRLDVDDFERALGEFLDDVTDELAECAERGEHLAWARRGRGDG
jgi:hypothetical protein